MDLYFWIYLEIAFEKAMNIKIYQVQLQFYVSDVFLFQNWIYITRILKRIPVFVWSVTFFGILEWLLRFRNAIYVGSGSLTTALLRAGTAVPNHLM